MGLTLAQGQDYYGKREIKSLLCDNSLSLLRSLRNVVPVVVVQLVQNVELTSVISDKGGMPRFVLTTRDVETVKITFFASPRGLKMMSLPTKMIEAMGSNPGRKLF